MRYKAWLGAAAVAAAAWPMAASAVTQDDFLARTTQDIVELCTAAQNDPLRREAVHFCHGFLVGAFQYHISVFPTSGPDALFCIPNPPPSRDAAIDAYMTWAKANPQHMGEKPTDTMFRYLAVAWPCRR